LKPPVQIEIVSDKNVLKLVSQVKEVITYEYVESKSKVGFKLPMDEKQLEQMIKNNIIKTLN
jgi:hypothetical protein